MAFGTVLENLSTKKLVLLFALFLGILLGCFLLGGLIAPNPSNVQNVLSTRCLDLTQKKRQKWFYPRGSGRCQYVPDFEDKQLQTMRTTSNQIVFAFQLPLPKDGIQLKFSRWFQNLISVLALEVEYQEKLQVKPGAMLTLDARIGYRNEGDGDGDWKELASATVVRPLECFIDDDKRIEGYHYNCSLLTFFELGSCHHHYYLINVRVPVYAKTNQNTDIGALKNLWLTVINQNGGFTKVWVSMKTVMFPIVLVVLIWFWRRVREEERPASFLEKSIMALGIGNTLLNVPLEWFTLAADMSWNLIITDVRQGVFYTILLAFWLIYLGEHYMETSVNKTHDVMTYWRHLTAVGVASLAMLLFELCERGVQLTNPFYSIWETETGANVAYGFIILALVVAVFYLAFLFYMVVCVMRRVSGKRAQLPSMRSATRRLYYQGLIYRFQVVLLVTVICATFTVVFFFLSQLSEGSWRWEESNLSIEYTSAFYTGVYGMWNVYTLLVLSLYAPSRKNKSTMGHLTITVNPEDEDESETIEFQRLNGGAVGGGSEADCANGAKKTVTRVFPAEQQASVFTAFMNKEKE